MKDTELYSLYELAYALGMSPQEFKRKHTSSEFNNWMAFVEKKRECEWNQVEQIHYYLAQIAAEIVRVNITDASTARSVKLEDFLLKFKDKSTATEVKSPEEVKKYIREQKLLFGGIFGAPVPEE